MSPFSEIKIPKPNSPRPRRGERSPGKNTSGGATGGFDGDFGGDFDDVENNISSPIRGGGGEGGEGGEEDSELLPLSFQFRDQEVPILHHPSIPYNDVVLAMSSDLFQNWVEKAGRVFGTRSIELHCVRVESLNILDDSTSASTSASTIDTDNDNRFVERINMKVESEFRDEDVKLVEGEVIEEYCCLRGSSAGILVALHCVEDDTVWSVLVDQPRLNVGAVSALELPVGFFDEDENFIVGPQAREVEESCGVSLKISDLVNLSQSAYENNSIYNASGLCPSLGNSSEFVKILYARKDINKKELKNLRKRLSQMREEGALMSLRVVPLEDLWKVSADMKVVSALFLLEKAGFENEQSSSQRTVYVEDENRGKPSLNLKSKLNSMLGMRRPSFLGQF